MTLDELMGALRRGAVLAVAGCGAMGPTAPLGPTGEPLRPYEDFRNRCEQQPTGYNPLMPDAPVMTVSVCTKTECFVPEGPRCPAPAASGLMGVTVNGPYRQPDGGTTDCCYIVMPNNPGNSFGRPLLDEAERARTARLVARTDWS
jgi:hypothetical protein